MRPKDITKKKVQSSLTFISNLKQTKVCSGCGLTFFKFIERDQQRHNSYHKTFLNGLTWSYNEVKYLDELVVKKTKVKLVAIDKDLSSQIKRVLEVLKMVNLELNAANNQWKEDNNAFLALAGSKVIGICTTDSVDAERQARWMVLRTNTIVPNQVNSACKVGISRIWVAPNWRRCGIAEKLLDMVASHSIYATQLHKREIAFSQPSTNGGLLARKFNGVAHKSGETLLLVYLED